jgi:hypothetical protein
MSYAKQERQRVRSTSGRYSNMNRCEACQKRLGSNYCSDGRFNGEYGHVLCEKCCLRGSAMTVEQAKQFYSRTV